MSFNLLKGIRGIIFGALDKDSVAWKTAETVYKEGGIFVLTNAPIATRLGNIEALAKKTGATSVEDLDNLVARSMELLGGRLDFLLHAIGMSKIVL